MFYFDDKNDGSYKPVDPEWLQQIIKDCEIEVFVTTVNCNLSEIQFLELKDIPEELQTEYLADIEEANKLGGVQMLHVHMDIELKWREKLGL